MKIYKTIDTLPLFNYSKVTEENELRYLMVLPDYFELPEIKDKDYKELFTAWEKINDEIIEYNGISEEYRAIMRARKSIAYLQVEMLETGDRSIENIIGMKERELLNMYPKTKQSIDESIVLLEDIKKREINIFTTTVKKYFAIIKSIKKHEKQN